MSAASDAAPLPGGTVLPPMTLRDRFLAWRDSVVARPGFRQAVARFPLTRGVARAQARGLFDLIAGLSFAVARADGAVDAGERALIVEHLRGDWGFDPAFITAAMPLLEADADDAAVEAAARGFASFLRGNPDCNTAAMQAELLAFLRELMRADGRIDPAEAAAVARIEAAFAPATGWSAGVAASASAALQNVRTLASGATDGALDLLNRARRRPG